MARAKSILTFQQMYNLYMDGVVGTKEFRNWLASKDDGFSAVRDADVDHQIDALARRREQLLTPDQEQSTLDSQS